MHTNRIYLEQGGHTWFLLRSFLVLAAATALPILSFHRGGIPNIDLCLHFSLHNSSLVVSLANSSYHTVLPLAPCFFGHLTSHLSMSPVFQAFSRELLMILGLTDLAGQLSNRPFLNVRTGIMSQHFALRLHLCFV